MRREWWEGDRPTRRPTKLEKKKSAEARESRVMEG
jgi:hypothetical protein